MSIATKEPKARRRRRKQDPGPELPMKADKPRPFGRIFRRKDRSAKLYAAFRDADGKIRVRSIGVATIPAAEEWLAMMQLTVAAQKARHEQKEAA